VQQDELQNKLALFARMLHVAQSEAMLLGLGVARRGFGHAESRICRRSGADVWRGTVVLDTSRRSSGQTSGTRGLTGRAAAGGCIMASCTIAGRAGHGIVGNLMREGHGSWKT
jgi:hypothetical protein